MNVLELATWFMRPVTIYGRGEVDATGTTGTAGLAMRGFDNCRNCMVPWSFEVICESECTVIHRN